MAFGNERLGKHVCMGYRAHVWTHTAHSSHIPPNLPPPRKKAVHPPEMVQLTMRHSSDSMGMSLITISLSNRQASEMHLKPVTWI